MGFESVHYLLSGSTDGSHIAIGRTFASMKDYQLDGNREMVALATMNLVGSFIHILLCGHRIVFSMSSELHGWLQDSSVKHCYVSYCTADCPIHYSFIQVHTNAILASIIIAAVVKLIDIDEAILLWKIDKFDFVACMGAFFGVIFRSVEIGLLIAVALSFAKILQVTRPRTAVLGKLPGTKIYRNIQQYPKATQVPGILIVRVDSAIYFSNSNYIKERILRWLADEEAARREGNLSTIQYLIVEMSPVTDIDTSGLHAFEELCKSLQKGEIQLILANPGAVVMEKLHASHLTSLIGEDKIVLLVGY